VGAVRASAGIATNEQDVERLLAFVKSFVDFVPTADHIWRMPVMEGS